MLKGGVTGRGVLKPVFGGANVLGLGAGVMERSIGRVQLGVMLVRGGALHV